MPRESRHLTGTDDRDDGVLRYTHHSRDSHYLFVTHVRMFRAELLAHMHDRQHTADGHIDHVFSDTSSTEINGRPI